MSYRGKYWEINDFKGGFCPDIAATNLGLDQASDMRMAVVGADGLYVRAMRGSAKGNSTEIGTAADTYPVQGVGQFILDDTSEFVVAVKKGKVFSAPFSAVQSGLTFTDRTGAFAGIEDSGSASNQATFNRTTFCQLNNIIIGFGGRFGHMDTPFKWTGSGNVSALGGTPPAASICFTTNNRVFAYGGLGGSSGLAELISWCVLGNPEDWTGTGSGSSSVGGSSDGERLLGHAVLSNNITLLFKKNNIYQMVTDAAPFAVTPLFKGVGVICPEAIVVINGVAWFINAEYSLCSTDGNSITEYSTAADSFFAYGNYNLFYRPIFAHRLTGLDYDWIIFTLNTYIALGNVGTFSGQMAWDLKNKCWIGINVPAITLTAGVPSALSNTLNASCISGATFSDGTFWGGFIAGGFLVQPDYAGLFNTHDTNAATFQSHWTTGWIKSGSTDMIVRPVRLAQQYSTTAAGGSITTEYGFDFVRDGSKTITFSVVPTASETITSRTGFILGRGNFFQMRHYLNGAANSTTLHGAMIYGKISGTRKLGV